MNKAHKVKPGEWADINVLLLHFSVGSESIDKPDSGLNTVCRWSHLRLRPLMRNEKDERPLLICTLSAFLTKETNEIGHLKILQNH